METTTLKGVMNASIDELKETIGSTLRLYDDLQQDIPDEKGVDYFEQLWVKAYHELESFWHQVITEGQLNHERRNSLRLTLKHYYKLIPENYLQAA